MVADDRSGKGILVIIASSLFKKEIVEEIKKLGLKADVTDLSVMRAIYSHKNVSFALWGIDILVRDILNRGGYDIAQMNYIEIGACHPILGNKTYNASLHGAKGVLIEPNPDLYLEIIKYRDDECIMQGVADKRGALTYYKFDNEFRNTFDKITAEDAVKKGFLLLETKELSVEPLEDIIGKCKIDTQRTILSMQIMGTELSVIKSFKYKKYNFPIIVLSIHSDEIFEYDIFKDYHLIAQVPYHVILVNQKIYSKIYGKSARVHKI